MAVFLRVRSFRVMSRFGSDPITYPKKTQSSVLYYAKVLVQSTGFWDKEQAMQHFARLIVLSVGLALTLQTVPSAHFKLLEPASWLIEDQRGDPQKAGPCGGSNTDWGKPSYIVTKATGGQKLHIKVQETIYHPGHYRVALAVNSPTELPRDPEAVTVDDADKGRLSVSAEIQGPPEMPVLADGLWPHTAKVDAALETDVLLPNINC